MGFASSQALSYMFLFRGYFPFPLVMSCFRLFPSLNHRTSFPCIPFSLCAMRGWLSHVENL